MRIYQCHFCSSPVYPGHGIMFVRNDAKEFRFCRSKGHKNFKQRRNPRKLRWTKTFKKSAGKKWAVDSTLNLCTKRNVPGKYNKNLVPTTLKAMSEIEEFCPILGKTLLINKMEGNKKGNF
ncbi:hypothetical protein Kpol_344p1 [Vanderwaltozyma polyspora DSM 70294]|uniref:Ribosome biogenesis protein RLP24 n=1 Tax=Vanderwaltozyma polyspora (strain ATCC 22028 / DSM 70294 / BCRC 21397 / CBS 2163 / NBRC 10782 / NRRL Y-8283 / UCD 57-17) TaxID=436907 RepID=A7TSR7_VANPO|nr:uncharacterized protein Kpol_344p1 [Vanderwaltozyma polyspora DSM 70294]EDO14681.1 hypothetical protein Kpol_344p1 [Vanderwaltozyma polyspora DSM 70294]